MPLPNFLVIGAPKAGTTALYQCLKQHPEIYMSPHKEPSFFAFDGEPPIFAGPGGDFFRRIAIWRRREYFLLFRDVTNQRAIGEASTIYLGSSLAARHIWRALPQARIVAILRQPAERAYSSFLFYRQGGGEPARTFAEALSQEDERRKAGWSPGKHHQRQGYYHAHLSVYYNLFPRKQIKVYLHEDWKNTPHVVLRDLFRFLEVDEHFVPEIRQSNVTLLPKSRRLHHLATDPTRVEQLTRFLPARARRAVISASQRMDARFNLAPPPPLDAEIRARLTADYREDILKLQDLIGRDLSHWLKT